MRVFLGMVLGCVITIGVAYLHDVQATSTVAGGTAETRQIVNWDVAQENWIKVQDDIRHAWLRLKDSVSS